jgi:LPS-assembly lipoprotein
MWWGEGRQSTEAASETRHPSPLAGKVPREVGRRGPLRGHDSACLGRGDAPSLPSRARGEGSRGARPSTSGEQPRWCHALLAPVLAASLALGGCVVRPLYADMPGTGTPVSVELSKIAVEPARDRVSQVLRNELIFGFTGGGEPGPPEYALRFFLTQTDAAVAVEVLSEVPAAYLVSLSASFVLSDARTGRTLLTGNSTADASYDFSSQRFANVRAQQDAQRRAAKTIAQDIRTRLAAYFAMHPRGQP